MMMAAHECRPQTIDLLPVARDNGLADLTARLTSFSLKHCRHCGVKRVAYTGSRITAAERRMLLLFAQETVAGTV